MTKQFNAISALAVGNGFEVAELQGIVFALLYGLWLTYPTPESEKLLAVDAYSAFFLAIGSGQLIGLVQRRDRLRRVMSLLALLIWVFTAFFSFGPAHVLFVVNAAWAFQRISRFGEHSTEVPRAAVVPVARGLIKEYALHDIYQ